MKYSYGKYINTFSFYVTVIQYISDFNMFSDLQTPEPPNMQQRITKLKKENHVVKEH